MVIDENHLEETAVIARHALLLIHKGKALLAVQRPLAYSAPPSVRCHFNTLLDAGICSPLVHEKLTLSRADDGWVVAKRVSGWLDVIERGRSVYLRESSGAIVTAVEICR